MTPPPLLPKSITGAAGSDLKEEMRIPVSTPPCVSFSSRKDQNTPLHTVRFDQVAITVYYPGIFDGGCGVIDLDETSSCCSSSHDCMIRR